jgi:hypothetical protein
MTTIRSIHRRRRPARPRRGTGLAIEAMEGRLALSLTLPLSPPVAPPMLVHTFPPEPIAPVQDVAVHCLPPDPC